MHDIFLYDIGSALPEWEVDNETIAQWCGAEPHFLVDKIGVRRRHFLRDDESSIELAAQACEKIFAKGDVSADHTDLLIFVTQNPEYGLPHSSALLQHRLGLPTHAACFDVGLGCSGYVHGLSIARGMMLTEGFTQTLLVTCDPYSRIMRKDDKGTMAVFGDAATASLLHLHGGARLGRGDFGTDGNAATMLMTQPARQGVLERQATCEEPAHPTLSMNGRGVFNFMLQRVPDSVMACLQKNALTLEDVDYFVFHQASRFMLETLAARMELPAEKVPIVHEDVANTVSSSIPLALEALQKQHPLTGKTVLLSGFGVGVSWATTILHF